MASVAGDSRQLSVAVRKRREALLAAWAEGVRQTARSRGRPPILLQALPAILDHLLGERRLELPEGELAEQLGELSALRDALRPIAPDAADRAADDLVREAAAQHVAMTANYGLAVERLLSAPAATLVDALLEGAARIDSAAIAVVEGKGLRLRSAVGLLHPLEGTSLPADGIASAVLRSRTPIALRNAHDDERVAASPLSAAGLRALHLVPLFGEAALLGVLVAGSRDFVELSALDLLLLRAAVARATALLAAEALREERAEAARIVSLQQDLARVLAEARGIDDAMQGALAAICEHLGWDAGLGWVVARHGHVLRCHGIYAGPSLGKELDPACTDRELHLGEGIAGEAWERGEPMLVHGVADAKEPMHDPAVVDAGIDTALVVPLRIVGQTVGVLELLSRERRGTPATEATETIGRQMAQFLRRAQMQEELHEREALEAAILASALDPFVAVDGELRVVDWNPAAERVFGWTHAEALGKDLCEVVLPERLRDAQRLLLRRQLEAAGSLLARHFELTAALRGGQEVPVEASVARIEKAERPLFAVAFRDITDRKRAERATRRMSETFRELIEAAPLPIFSMDREGHIQIWNRAAERLTGWTRDEVVGRDNPTVGGDRAAWDRILDMARSGEVVTGAEVAAEQKAGGRVDLSVSLAPLSDAGGKVVGVIVVGVDVTEQKRSHAELSKTARFREQFVGIVGHDLRNPLSAILTASELLLRHGGLADRQARAVTRIAASAERMARMIDDLLDFTRSRLGGGFPISPRRVDLRELCAQVIEELELAHPERTIDFQAEGDAWGSWDPDRIAQVISNLIGNALTHSPDSATVRVRLADEQDRVVLTTNNAGPPIPAEVVPHLFEPGRRGPPRHGRAGSSGLGLGLYIVQQIVLAHGGRIDVASDAADGTTFTVTLPRRSRALP
jgi:PAS domain S-box-containing protein